MKTAKLRLGDRVKGPPKRNGWRKPQRSPLGIGISAIDAKLVFEVLALYELLESTSGRGRVHGRAEQP
jgi:hypothetical protein